MGDLREPEAVIIPVFILSLNEGFPQACLSWLRMEALRGPRPRFWLDLRHLVI